MTMRTSGLDLDLHKTYGERGLEVTVVLPVFRRAKGDYIKLLF